MEKILTLEEAKQNEELEVIVAGDKYAYKYPRGCWVIVFKGFNIAENSRIAKINEKWDTFICVDRDYKIIELNTAKCNEILSHMLQKQINILLKNLNNLQEENKTLKQELISKDENISYWMKEISDLRLEYESLKGSENTQK